MKHYYGDYPHIVISKRRNRSTLGPSNIVIELNWGWKKVSKLIEKLESQGRVKKKTDSGIKESRG